MGWRILSTKAMRFRNPLRASPENRLLAERANRQVPSPRRPIDAQGSYCPGTNFLGEARQHCFDNLSGNGKGVLCFFDGRILCITRVPECPRVHAQPFGAPERWFKYGVDHRALATFSNHDFVSATRAGSCGIEQLPLARDGGGKRRAQVNAAVECYAEKRLEHRSDPAQPHSDLWRVQLGMIFEETDHVAYIVDLLAGPPLRLFGRRKLRKNQIVHRRELK